MPFNNELQRHRRANKLCRHTGEGDVEKVIEKGRIERSKSCELEKSYVFLKLMFKPFDLAVVKSGSFPRDVDVLDHLIPRVMCIKQLQFDVLIDAKE